MKGVRRRVEKVVCGRRQEKRHGRSHEVLHQGAHA